MEEELRISKGRVLQVVGGGAATAKLREPKHARTRGTELESDERKLRNCRMQDRRQAVFQGDLNAWRSQHRSPPSSSINPGVFSPHFFET